jgi:hypothetical protein
MAMADAAEVPYVKSSEDIDVDETPYDTEIALALKEAAEETGVEMLEETTEIKTVETEEPRGLMARRAK